MAKKKPKVDCVCRNFLPIRIHNYTEKKWYLQCAICGREASGKDKKETLKNWAKVQSIS